MTGVIGAAFTWWLNTLSGARDVEVARRARAAEAVREITDLINERRTRAVLVAYAIHRKSSQTEVEARKTAYDDVYVRWNTKSQSISLRIRDISQQLAPSDYEGYISALTNEVALDSESKGLLTQMDTCVTNAFDAYSRV